MPGPKFTKNADTPRRQRMWDDVYGSAKRRGMDDKHAIMMANSAVKKDKDKRKRKSTNPGRDAKVATGKRG